MSVLLSTLTLKRAEHSRNNLIPKLMGTENGINEYYLQRICINDMINGFVIEFCQYRQFFLVEQETFHIVRFQHGHDLYPCCNHPVSQDPHDSRVVLPAQGSREQMHAFTLSDCVRPGAVPCTAHSVPF
ncbi:hypothetical protein J6590_098464 [Homalodisca vitripennis]|nr:hypothetical protein J6590_098464 [Homalodisca vitripennis]